MKIVISNVNSGFVYNEIEDPTSAQVMAYMGSSVIIMLQEEFIVDCAVMDHDNKVLNIMVFSVEENIDDNEVTEIIEEKK